MRKKNFCCFCCRVFYVRNFKFVRYSSIWKNSCQHYDDFKQKKPLQVETNSSRLFKLKNKKCFACFSKNHKTEECEEKLSSSNMFLPNIDYQLIPRFMQISDVMEQYSLAFSYKAVFNNFQPKPLIVAKTATFDGNKFFLPYFEGSNILITKSFRINLLSSEFEGVGKGIYDRLFPSISSKAFIVRVKVIKIRSTKISRNNFFQLLSPKLIELYCEQIQMSPPEIESSKFIKMTPNIEILRFEYTNIIFHKLLWIKKLRNCNSYFLSE